ncbi:hypothetical protein ACFSKW_37410 [Nonomuraea mangrovi]|uniref:Fibronectin type-III domain-containing protein n=1 Tax=Nonomuraea mangrovi TaxID=2316207 RepID=A0ABW4T7E2_9ACTN
MTAVRRLMAAGVVMPIVIGVAVFGVATPAQARADIDMPSRVTTNAPVTIQGTVDLAFDAVLYVDGTEVAKGNQRVTYTWNPAEHANGSFQIRLVQKGKLLGGKWDENTSTLRQAIPAEPPSGVAAALSGDGKIVVTWSKGSEPDLQSYEISTSQSGSVGKVSADSACSGGSCKATLAVPGKAAGQQVGFTVKAFRSDGEGGMLGSANSSAAYVTIPAPAPPAQPKAAQTKQAQSDQQAKNTRKSVASLPSIPPKKRVTPTVKPQQTVPKSVSKMPALPATETDKKGEYRLPTAKPKTSDDETLVPAGEDEAAKKPEAEAVDTSVRAQSSQSPIGNIGQYGIYVAGGLLLLLLAAHGGAWARRRALASAGGGPAAAPAPPTADTSQPGDSIPPTATAPRRPAVVLAVAKTRKPQPHVPEQPGPESAGLRLPLYMSAEEAKTSEPAVRPEPIRLALPSSAVTTVAPEPEIPPVLPAAVRIEDRWDDYLPPAPRSMEDSGFWERPQPGAGDFWAADDDEAAYIGRRHLGGES